MDRLLKIGEVQPINSRDIKDSRMGLGMEKLDRDAFDPEKVYDRVAALGVKWIRIQSGWQKTEKCEDKRIPARTPVSREEKEHAHHSAHNYKKQKICLLIINFFI